MDINTALRAFVRTVEKGSVTGAARDLAISQPAVTKHLRNLERHVNARLLERSSKTLRPTAHGMTLYEVSRHALLRSTLRWRAFVAIWEKSKET